MTGPSARNISSSINLGTAIKDTPLYVGGSVFGGINFDEDFENGVEFIGTSLNLGAGIPLDKRTILRPGIAATRQWSARSENNSISASAILGVSHVITPKLLVSANARVTRTWFDDFFEDVTFISRRDWQYGANLSASYQISKNFSLNTGVGYSRRDSTFFVSEFDSFDTSLFASVRIRF